MAALVDLAEVDEVGVRALGPATRRLIALAGDLIAAGTEISVVLCAAALLGLPPAFSQYSRPAEVPVLVSQYSVMSSSTCSFVGDLSASVLSVQWVKPPCTSIRAARPAGESAMP